MTPPEVSTTAPPGDLEEPEAKERPPEAKEKPRSARRIFGGGPKVRECAALGCSDTVVGSGRKYCTEHTPKRQAARPRSTAPAKTEITKAKIVSGVSGGAALLKLGDPYTGYICEQQSAPIGAAIYDIMEARGWLDQAGAVVSPEMALGAAILPVAVAIAVQQADKAGYRSTEFGYVRQGVAELYHIDMPEPRDYMASILERAWADIQAKADHLPAEARAAYLARAEASLLDQFKSKLGDIVDDRPTPG